MTVIRNIRHKYIYPPEAGKGYISITPVTLHLEWGDWNPERKTCIKN